jgi:hypothetical protein
MVPFTYETELAAHPLDCEIEYEPEEVGDLESPGYPAVYRLCSIAIAGVDITGLVSNRVFREVEEAAYDYFEGGRYVADNFNPPDGY